MLNKYYWLTFLKNSTYFNPRLWNLPEFTPLKYMGNTSTNKCVCMHAGTFPLREDRFKKDGKAHVLLLHCIESIIQFLYFNPTEVEINVPKHLKTRAVFVVGN